MNKLLVMLSVLQLSFPVRAGLLDFLGLGKGNTNQIGSSTLPVSLSQDQVVQGLKEALSKGVQQAIASLGHDGGFLTNLNVRIPLPEKLQTAEKALRMVKQDKLADEFVATMNHAAEQAVPQAASVFAESIRSLSIADAKAILLSTNNAATEYFRRTTETNLFTRFLPVVKQATDRAGVTSAYKQLVEASNLLGSFGRSLSAESVDLDSYITGKSLDGLFTMIATKEKRIREDPVARTSELLQKVFGAVRK